MKTTFKLSQWHKYFPGGISGVNCRRIGRIIALYGTQIRISVDLDEDWKHANLAEALIELEEKLYAQTTQR